MTGQSTYGELKGGKMQRCSLLLAKSLVRPDCRWDNQAGPRAARIETASDADAMLMPSPAHGPHKYRVSIRSFCHISAPRYATS